MSLKSANVLAASFKIVERYSHLNWTLADQTIVSGTNFITGVLLARHLGLNQFGQFNLVWMVILFLQNVQFALIFAPMTSIGPKQSADTVGSYYAVVFLHQLLFALLSTIVVFTGVLICSQAFREWNIGPLIWPVSAIALVGQIQDFLRRYFFSIGRPGVSFLIDAVRYGGQAIVLLWLFLFSSWQPDVVGVLWAMLIPAGASAVTASIKINKLEWPTGGWWEISLRHWIFSKWLLGTNVAGWFSGEIYYVIAGGIIGASAVGVLKSAQNVMGVTHIFFQGMQNFLPIRASRAYREGGIVQLSNFLKKTCFFITLTTVGIALIVSISPNRVMDLFYGPAFGNYGWVLVGYAIIYVLIALGQIIPIGLLAAEKTFPIFLAYVCSGIISTIIVYPLVNEFRLSGVLVGLATYHAVQIIVQFSAFQRLAARATLAAGRRR